MICAAPHYLLFSEASSDPGPTGKGGKWRFVLEKIGGSQKIEVADEEPIMRGERLQLLAVVRGLEALDQPSKVTLVTSSKHIARGLRVGLASWRKNNFHWERFGAMTLIKNHDLWRRIDHALKYHDVDCRVWQFQTSAPVEKKQGPAASTRNSSFRPVAAKSKRGIWMGRRRSKKIRWSEVSDRFCQKVKLVATNRRQYSAAH